MLYGGGDEFTMVPGLTYLGLVRGAACWVKRGPEAMAPELAEMMAEPSTTRVRFGDGRGVPVRQTLVTIGERAATLHTDGEGRIVAMDFHFPVPVGGETDVAEAVLRASHRR